MLRYEGFVFISRRILRIGALLKGHSQQGLSRELGGRGASQPAFIPSAPSLGILWSERMAGWTHSICLSAAGTRFSKFVHDPRRTRRLHDLYPFIYLEVSFAFRAFGASCATGLSALDREQRTWQCFRQMVARARLGAADCSRWLLEPALEPQSI